MYDPVLPANCAIKVFDGGDQSVREEAAIVAFGNYRNVQNCTILASAVLTFDVVDGFYTTTFGSMES